MDQRERMNDPFEALKLILDGRQVKIWTSLPGIIQQYYPNTQTADVQPSIQGIVTDSGGNTKNVNLPKLLDCPVQFPGGGSGGTTGQQSTWGSTNTSASTPNLATSVGGNQPYGVTITFPVQPGDECLIVFTSRGFDNWWQSGGIQPPMEARMHDLSDGFIQLGYRSQPRKLDNVSTTNFQIRTDDAQSLIELDAQNKVAQLRSGDNQTYVKADFKNKNVNIGAPNGSTINANTTINGNLHVTGTITGDQDVVTGSISLKNHTHPGVQTGTGSTGTPQG